MSGPRAHRIALDTGLHYHVLEWGADAPALEHTVILIHGFLDLAWSWQPVVDADLAGRFHLVAPDMRGHGDSDRVGAGGYYHFFDYLADLHALIERVGRSRVSLVGHSMGGSICGYYAGAYPDRVHRLALLEGTGPPERDQPVPDRVVTWLASWQRARSRAPRRYESIEAAAARLQTNDSLLGDELARFLADKGTVPAPDGGRQFKHDPLHVTMGPYPFRVDVAQQFWRRITCPVLLVEGEKSAFRYSDDERARRYGSFADARVEPLPGAGHMMMRHQPAALAAMLADFLAS